MDKPIKTWRTAQRDFRVYKDRVYKRSLRPGERRRKLSEEVVTPPQDILRLENEAACLRFIREHTRIPVPKVLNTYEADGTFTLVTEYIPGRSIEDLFPQDQAKIKQELQGYIAIMQSLRSDCPGGPTGIMCPVPRVAMRFPGGTTWKAVEYLESDYAFCHCDLNWSNIVIDSDFLEIRAILGWECAGYWPDYFELPYYHDMQSKETPVADWKVVKLMTEFFKSQLAWND